VATTFQLTKTYTSGPQTHVRLITKPVDGSVRIALDGVEQISGWSADSTTGLVTFDIAPASGVVIAAGFEFDVPVRFDSDVLEISLDTFRAGTIPDVPLVEVRIA
jgi:uncharacterized protein (TIGR02217 family)